MKWNWELKGWPKFTWDLSKIHLVERQFLLQVGNSSAYLKTLDSQDYYRFIVEILSLEGVESSRIEGEILDRESLQSSIKKQFGLEGAVKKQGIKESHVAELLCSVYASFDQPLTHEMLYKWHAILFKDSVQISDSGKYRTHQEPMQIVSSRYNNSRVFFEAPPSDRVFEEMTSFINWFNSTDSSASILGKASIAHVYFESIHPFEDGNGRIGRVLVEKILSRSIGRPLLIATSQVLEKRKKEYYSALEKCNRTLDVQHWIEFFSSVIIEAHQEAIDLLYFLIAKAKMMNALSGQINERQIKVLLRMFAEGPSGFKGGLSANNYISITKTTKATATRDLVDLVEKGALVREGKLRYTRYGLRLYTS